ncbi:MAG TPA: hypothetical protein VMM83_02280 [Longimicrobiales bacterium]|nr:hypothetical protein [Longimicrobiales bacterium]
MNRSATTAAGAPLAVMTAMTLTVLAFALGPAATAGQNGGPLGSPIPGVPLGEPARDAPDAGARSFLTQQLAFARVADARESTDDRLRQHFAEAGVDYPAPEIYLRVFKHERELELWARSDPDAAYTLVKRYPVCSLPGQLGPKRAMGDVQVPEGFYFIDDFNPRSDFHLSLRVNYPNVADRMRRRALALGGDIFIHGGCATVGCVPIEDRNIEEVYWAAVQATDAGQRLIPIHIFPARLDEDNLRWLESTFSPEAELLAFWQNLSQGYAFFEETRRVPWVTVAENGEYAVPDLPALAAEDAPEGIAADTTRDTGTTGPGGADAPIEPVDSTAPPVGAGPVGGN